MIEYPKMLYSIDGSVVVCLSKLEEDAMREQGWTDLAEVAAATGANTAPAAGDELLVIEPGVLPATSVYDPDVSENVPPAVSGLTPMSGPDGTIVQITGANFQPQGEHSQVKIGTVNAFVRSWAEDAVEIEAVQGVNVLNAPLVVSDQMSSSSFLTSLTRSLAISRAISVLHAKSA